MKKRVVTAVVLAIAAHWHSQSLAQSGALISNNDLSKESENPVTRLIMLPLRGNDTWLLQATLTFIFPVPGSSRSRP
jgi:hypothetical protein